MDKIDNLEGINKYYCSEHKKFHIRKFKYKFNKEGLRIKTRDTPFFNCKKFAYKLTSSELFNLQFKRSYQLYTIKKHKESNGSNKR